MRSFRTDFSGQASKVTRAKARARRRVRLMRLVIRYYTRPPWHLRIQYQTCYNLPLSRAKLWVASQLCCRTLHPSLDPEALLKS